MDDAIASRFNYLSALCNNQVAINQCGNPRQPPALCFGPLQRQFNLPSVQCAFPSSEFGHSSICSDFSCGQAATVSLPKLTQLSIYSAVTRIHSK